MSRILLADDSPHAQRMGERILTDEGYRLAFAVRLPGAARRAILDALTARLRASLRA